VRVDGSAPDSRWTRTPAIAVSPTGVIVIARLEQRDGTGHRTARRAVWRRDVPFGEQPSPSRRSRGMLPDALTDPVVIPMRILASSIALCTLVLSPAAAQQSRTFTKPEAEFPEPFSQLVSLRELRDGRVIVVDTRENALQVVDFRAGTVTPIGRQGSGPGEWQSPRAVYPLLGDSTLVQDPANGRFLIVGPDAKPARVFIPSGGGDGILRAVDARGLMYYQSALAQGDTPKSVMDSTPVVRYDPMAMTHDTLAWVAVERPAPRSGTSGGATFVLRTPGPFSPADDWTIFPDGRLVITRVADYHVEIVATGAPPAKGPPVPFTAIPVTEADKQQVRDARRNNRVSFRSAGGQPVAPPANFQLPDPEWHPYKPPFAVGATRVAPNGDIWVLRHRPASDSVPVYDVFNGRGQLTARVSLPRGGALVGFGARSAYLVRVDADGLQYLQRFALG
jgi:hypothetical protein